MARIRVLIADDHAMVRAGLRALLDAQPGQQVLDACVAPGGKTSHVLETCAGVRVTAVDVDERRLARVRENLARLRLDAEVVAGDAARPTGAWAQKRYDRILLDVPCTATGVIRRHPDIKLLRRAEDVAGLAARQADILDAVWPLLAPDGMLLYVTCSIIPQENRLQVASFLARTAGARPMAPAHPALARYARADGAGFQILPGAHELDGFFYAALVREH